MKRLITTALVSLLVLSAAASQSPAQDKSPRGTLKAVAVEKGPAIDGTLKDAAWQKCPSLELGDCTSTKPLETKTTARVLFDPTQLYIAWECEDSDTDGLAQGAAARDSDVWKDDCVELFVSGDPRVALYHFAINPKGTLFDAKTAGGTKDDKSYTSSAVVKTSVEKGKGWTVTLAVPLKDLSAYVGENQKWTLNLNRTRPARGGKQDLEWSWAVMNSNDFHQAADYGQVTGIAIAKREDGVTREASPAPEAPKADKGEEIGGVTVYKKLAELAIPVTKDGPSKSLDLHILNAKNLRLAFNVKAPAGIKDLPLNLTDKRKNDNTTSKSYRTVGTEWKPIIYYVDRFRYNGGAPDGTIAANCEFTGLRFHGAQFQGDSARIDLQPFVIYRGVDAAAPEAPADLTAQAAADGVKLAWKPAKDNVGVAFYVVSRAGADGKFQKVAESPVPQYVDRPTTAGEYKYCVAAVDFEDNVGAWSAVASAKTDKTFDARTEKPEEKDRPGYADYVRKIHQAGKGKVNKGVVLCFGDSLTGATMYRVGIEASLGRYRVEAEGRAGWRTDACRKVIDGDLKKYNPAVCLILLGTNNGKGAKELPPAMDDLLFMAKACEANGTIPIIGTVPPRGFGDPESKPEAGYNVELIKMCRENKLPIAYIFEALQAAGDRKKLIAGDGVHFSEGGWDTLSPAWEAAVRQVNFVLLDRE